MTRALARTTFWRRRRAAAGPTGTLPANTVAPAITGTAQIGQTLSCSTGTWTGTAPITYAYQWKRAGADISGANSSAYDPVSADLGAVLTCVVTAINSAGNVSATSAATAAVTQAPINTVVPAITGTAAVGSTLTCSQGTWTGTATISFAYQWKRGGTNIGSATASTYLLVAADAAALITCTVTGTNGIGNSSATTAATAAVTQTPANTVLPAITGTTTVGSTLTCSTGTWTGAPAPTFAYQWKRAGTNIAGATASTYVLAVADLGTAITCAVTGTNSTGNATATSAATNVPMALSNIATQIQTTGISPLDIPFTTVTGNILLRIVVGDTGSTVESPYTVVFDPTGANLSFTIQRQIIGSDPGSAEGAGAPRMIIATIRNVPITGVSKTIRFSCFAANLSHYAVCIADLPAAWSGTIGNSAATASMTPAKNSHTSAAIVTAGANSLLVACGGERDGTLGALNISGQGGTWGSDVAQVTTAASVSGYQARFASKLVAAAATTVDFGVTLAGGGTPLFWSAGVLEIRT